MIRLTRSSSVWILVATSGLCLYLYLETVVLRRPVILDQLVSREQRQLHPFIATIFTTAVLHSSALSTSSTVQEVGSTIDREQGVPMVLGAAFGTTVTCLLLSLVFFSGNTRSRQDKYGAETALQLAVCHALINAMGSVLILGLELLFGIPSTFAARIAPLFRRIQTVQNSPLIDFNFPQWEPSSITLAYVISVLMLLALAGIGISVSHLTSAIDEFDARTSLSLPIASQLLMTIIATVLLRSSSVATCIFAAFFSRAVRKLGIDETDSIRGGLPKLALATAIGANLGTAVTAIVVALDSASPGPLEVALVHCLAKMGALTLFGHRYALRAILFATKNLARGAVAYRPLGVAITVVIYYLLPLIVLRIEM
ncbi:MAG: hypothetical protein R2729_30480 [Bryobacteraceae bacterium]